MSIKTFSPLRYPGGKACLANFITDLVDRNGLVGGTYIELFAGGAGAALDLLFNNIFSQIHINDYDYHIYSMWYSILHHPVEFINRINETEISIEEWKRQQGIYMQGRGADVIDLGFATFFLNRTNRSGIIYKAGPIGGINQTGNYKIDVRFNKQDLIHRIEKIHEYRRQIFLTNMDAVYVLRNLPRFHPDLENTFIYLDPPYYKKGKLLYLNNYKHENHLQLSNTVSEFLPNINWLISYDNVSEIKALYQGYRMSSFDLNYTLQSKRFGSELLIFSNVLEIPHDIQIKSRTSELTLI